MYKIYYRVDKLDENEPWPTPKELVMFCDGGKRPSVRGLIRKLTEHYAIVDVFNKLIETPDEKYERI